MALDMSIVRSSEKLELPNDSAALKLLQERALYLSCIACPDLALRTELAAICQLQANGKLTIEETYHLSAKLMRRDKMLETAPDCEALLDNYGAGNATWQNLQLMCTGQQPLIYPVFDSAIGDDIDTDTFLVIRDEQGQQWQRWAKDMLNLLRHLPPTVEVDEILEYMPTNFYLGLRNQTVRQSFDGLYGLGASLMREPVGLDSAARWLGDYADRQQALVLADELASIVLDRVKSLEELKKTDSKASTEQVTAAERRLDLWWHLLKAYVAAANYPGFDHPFVSMLAHNSAVTERICKALWEGLKAISTGTQYWKGGTHEAAKELMMIPTQKLIDQLRAAIAKHSDTRL